MIDDLAAAAAVAHARAQADWGAAVEAERALIAAAVAEHASAPEHYWQARHRAGLRLAALTAIVAAFAGCTAPPAGTFSAEPIGRSTYGTIDGKRVRLWQDTLTHTTTGTIGDKNVRLKSY